MAHPLTDPAFLYISHYAHYALRALWLLLETARKVAFQGIEGLNRRGLQRGQRPLN